VVERQLPKLHVVGSIPIARSRALLRGFRTVLSCARSGNGIALLLLMQTNR